MAKVIANLTVRLPKWRLGLVQIIIPFIAPFIRSDAVLERFCSAMSAFVLRGLRVYADGRRVD